jgi:quinol monooxygenase YgiN
MITVMARLRTEDWDAFRAAHDEPARLQLRRDRGNLSHQVFNQLDDTTDVVFLDIWDDPQGSDSYYHSDDFQRDLTDMGATLMELIKLEPADVEKIGDARSAV